MVRKESLSAYWIHALVERTWKLHLRSFLLVLPHVLRMDDAMTGAITGSIILAILALLALFTCGGYANTCKWVALAIYRHACRTQARHEARRGELARQWARELES